ncbi:MAG: hypothetical protein L0Z55_07510 [Planctomycetes bacterium]|nr:hypothetical protein [Planctomycetota bacterium]
MWTVRILILLAITCLVLYICQGIAYGSSEDEAKAPASESITEGRFAFPGGEDRGAAGAGASPTLAAPAAGAAPGGSDLWAEEKRRSREALRDWLRRMEPRDEARTHPQAAVPSEGGARNEVPANDGDEEESAESLADPVIVERPAAPDVVPDVVPDAAPAAAPDAAPDGDNGEEGEDGRDDGDREHGFASEGARGTSPPKPRLTRFTKRGAAAPAAEAQAPPDLPRALGEIADGDLPWTSSLDLALAIEAEFAGMAPSADPRVLRAELFHHLIDLSVRVGHTDNPRENLEAIRAYAADTLHLEAVDRERYPLELLRPSTVLSGKRGSPAAVAQVLLVLADRLNPYLDLEPVVAGDLLGLRYRGDNHRYTLLPAEPGRLYSDRELAERAFGKDETPAVPIRALTRKQFCGCLLGEFGAALAARGELERAARFLDRGIALYAAQPGARIARSRIFLERLDLESAREELDAAVMLAPDSTAARVARIELLEMIGDENALEEDLRFLAATGGDARRLFQLAELLYRARRTDEALSSLSALDTRADLPAEVAGGARDLRARIRVAPWVAALLDRSLPAANRFQALERLKNVPLREVDAALIAAMGDENLRLGRYAWQALRTQTGWDLPLDPAAWERAFARPPQAAGRASSASGASISPRTAMPQTKAPPHDR